MKDITRTAMPPAPDNMPPSRIDWQKRIRGVNGSLFLYNGLKKASDSGFLTHAWISKNLLSLSGDKIKQNWTPFLEQIIYLRQPLHFQSLRPWSWFFWIKISFYMLLLIFIKLINCKPFTSCIRTSKPEEYHHQIIIRQRHKTKYYFQVNIPYFANV